MRELIDIVEGRIDELFNQSVEVTWNNASEATFVVGNIKYTAGFLGSSDIFFYFADNKMDGRITGAGNAAIVFSTV